MKGYVKAMRLPVCILGGMLTVVGYRLSGSGLSQSWFPAFFVLCGLAATMVWNDWRDRFHDERKGKDFALKAGQTFFFYALGFWALVFILAISITAHDLYRGALAFSMILGGLTYSETRKIPFVPNSLVALVSASPVLLSNPLSPTHNHVMIFLATGLAIYAREIIKDYEDSGVDSGYKWTLVEWAGERVAYAFVICLFALAATCLTSIARSSPRTSLFAMQLAENNTAILAICAILGLHPKLALPIFKVVLDAWVAAYLLSIIAYGTP